MKNIVKKYDPLLKSKNRPGFAEKMQNFDNTKYEFPVKVEGRRKRKFDTALEEVTSDTLKTVVLDLSESLNHS